MIEPKPERADASRKAQRYRNFRTDAPLAILSGHDGRVEPIPDNWPDEMRSYWALLVNDRSETVQNLIDSAGETRLRRNANSQSIRDEIATRWAEGWTYFDAVLFGMEQNTFAMNDRIDINDEHQPVRGALALLHASSTMTLHEIRALLREGMVTGAAARWRALYELAVTANLVAHGEAPIAERYLAHGYIIQVRRLEEFYAQPHPDAPPIEAREARLQEAARLAQRYSLSDQSSPFESQYGWATPLMDRGRDGRYLRPTFDRLEKAAGFGHLRILMHSAHGHVHNDAAGVRSAVVPSPGDLLLGARPDQGETVAVPTMHAVIQVVLPIHLGFEPELNDTSRLLGLLGVGICEVARRCIEAFGNPAPVQPHLF